MLSALELTPPIVALPPRSSASRLAALAVQSLLAEARLTPKPGLVDARGSGAHHDLSLPLFERSAHALEPWFAAMARAAEMTTPGTFLRQTLGSLGRSAERAMLAATGGANTHRGAIWAIGLLVASAASRPQSVAELCNGAAAIAALRDSFAGLSPSHGCNALLRFGATGARGEAVAGFPHVRLVGLPALRAARAHGVSETHARLDALMAIMGTLEDTCILHRGGREALIAAQTGASAVLAAGGSATASGGERLRTLDRTLLALWVSPGGSADLLSATLLVDALFPEPQHA